MFHRLFHLDVYPSQQVDSVIPPNLKIGQQVGYRPKPQKLSEAFRSKNIWNTQFRATNQLAISTKMSPPVWMELFFSVNHVFPPPPRNGVESLHRLRCLHRLRFLYHRLRFLYHWGRSLAAGRFLEGRWFIAICSEKKYPRNALCLFNKWGWTHHFYVRQKKSYIQWSTEKQLSPHQTSDWLIMVCSVSYFTS